MELARTIFVLYVTIADVSAVRFCGKQLADMLDLVCAERGFHWRHRDSDVPYIAKRSTFYHVSVTASPPVTTERGVVTECCRKACSMADLESYCALPAEPILSHPTVSPLAHLFTSDVVTNGGANPLPTPTLPPLVVSSPPPRPSSLRPSNRFRFPIGAGARVLGFLGIGTRNKFFFVRPVGPRPTRSPLPN